MAKVIRKSDDLRRRRLGHHLDVFTVPLESVQLHQIRPSLCVPVLMHAAPMTLERHDYDKAALHLKRALELFDRENDEAMPSAREILALIVRRLSPGDFYAGDAAPDITLLRTMAAKVTTVQIRSEILNAVAVLREEG